MVGVNAQGFCVQSNKEPFVGWDKRAQDSGGQTQATCYVLVSSCFDFDGLTSVDNRSLSNLTRGAARISLCCHEPNTGYTMSFAQAFVPCFLQMYLNQLSAWDAADTEGKTRFAAEVSHCMDSVWMLLDMAVRDVDEDIEESHRFAIFIHSYYLWAQIFQELPRLISFPFIFLSLSVADSLRC
jgi:hypothetical protein